MSTMSDYLDDSLVRVREVYPPVRTLGMHRTSDHPERSYYVSAHHNEKLGGGMILGYGSTPEEALTGLCETLRELLEKQRVGTLCVVCRELGNDVPGDLSTGDGMMCRKHAIEWLQSERQAADESVGPCGVKS